MEAIEDMRNKRVVVAVDEGEESMEALSWCLTNLLTQFTCATSLLLLYVKPPPPVYSTLDPTGYFFAGDDAIADMKKYGSELANSVMNKAESICRKFNTSIKVEKKVGCGEAKDVICAAVENLKADILVMGNHDYGFFKRALVGSVSEYCAKHVKCPVVVVKTPKTIISSR
ncbi:PREDICTED: universal stress protein A-like protein [Ipomoea nil]|uniref:universal stress protein A-like protein n=1 Tax=Ipomoea nil TaxID=35883 RepID=UPI0009019532|nr:PREDICTED: universal stress protein A-like protein [Ipomoea nil]